MLSKLEPGASAIATERAVFSNLGDSLHLLLSAAGGDTRQLLREYGARLDAHDFAALVVFRAAGKTWEEYVATRRSLSARREQELHQLYSAEDIGSLASELGDRFLVARLKGFTLGELDGEKAALVKDVISGWGEERFYKYARKMKGADLKNCLPILGSAIDVINVLIILRSKIIGSTNVKAHLVPARWKLDQTSLEQLIAFQDVGQALDFMASHYYYRTIFGGARQKYEDTKSLAFLEIGLRQHQLHLSKRIFLGFPYSVGIVLAFLTLKENEARNLAGIMTGVDSNLPSDQVRSLLALVD
jgi:vacuolar-type H+-ATPase subunit C/Vma6